jgi:hypothetical protein
VFGVPGVLIHCVIWVKSAVTSRALFMVKEQEVVVPLQEPLHPKNTASLNAFSDKVTDLPFE